MNSKQMLLKFQAIKEQKTNKQKNTTKNKHTKEEEMSTDNLLFE